MNINGTLINYYFHCKRQCYLFANRINMEDNSEDVRIGRVLHEIRQKNEKNTEIKYDNMIIDKITQKNIEEYKKSDSDTVASKMQLLFYLKNLNEKGIEKEGKLIFEQKNKKEKMQKVVLNDESKKELEECITAIKKLISEEKVPDIEKKKSCKNCAYYEYCYL